MGPSADGVRSDRVRHAHRALRERRIGKALIRIQRCDAWRGLGFVRLADYVEERLGLGVRTAQELVRAEKALARLPRTAAAWASGRITAGHLRILTRVATERTERWWLGAATRLRVAELAAAVVRWRRAEAEGVDPAFPGAGDEAAAEARDETPGIARASSLHASGDDVLAETCEEEPESVREVLRVPAWIAVLWKQTLDHVRTVVGRRVHSGGCLDVLLAEAQGAQPVGDLEAPARTDWPRRAPQRAAPGILDKLDRLPIDPDRTTWKWYLTPPEPRRSARELDEDLFRMVGERQREEAELAERVRRAARSRSYRDAGHRTLEAWGRAELGLSPRRLYYLLALGRRLESLPALRGAFLEGRLSMKKAVLVGSVATPRTEAAWIERAAGATLRRLDDEVAWWRQLKDVRPEVWGLLDGGPLPEGIVLDPGRDPRLHASARGRTDDTFDEEAVDGLHAGARGGARDRGIRCGPAGCKTPGFECDNHAGPQLHAGARGGEDGRGGSGERVGGGSSSRTSSGTFDVGVDNQLHASARGEEGRADEMCHSARWGDQGTGSGVSGYGRSWFGHSDDEVAPRLRACARGGEEDREDAGKRVVVGGSDCGYSEFFDDEAIDELPACALGGARDLGIDRGPADRVGPDEDLDARLPSWAPGEFDDRGTECGSSGRSDEDVAARLLDWALGGEIDPSFAGRGTGCDSPGRGSNGSFDKEVDRRLHASARGEASDRSIGVGASGYESSPFGYSDDPVAPRLHVCPSDDDGPDPAGAAAGRPPITARAFLAALEADETAVPLPAHLCSLTFWLEPEVHEAWKARCAAHRHESGEPMDKWVVLALLMHNWWKTHENEETRRQRREHKTLNRDGWRCKAPGCSSMGNGMLHEHHVIYKSRGGSVSDPSNVISLCSAHHLSLLHNGYMRCYGEAPDNITWEMGIGDGREPFLIYHGDRLIGGTAVSGQRPRGDDDAIG